MAGIYLHIPFCKQACHYCNFHFSTSMSLRNDFSKALLKEIALRKNYPEGERIETVYFGGERHRCLLKESFHPSWRELHTHFDISSSAEITFEANP